MGKAFSWFVPGYRRLVRRNLRIAFAGEKSREDVKQLTAEHFSALGRNFLVSLKTALMPIEEIEKRVTYEGREHIEAAAALGKGLIGAISHLANWELYARLPSLGAGIAPATLYQKVKNPFLNRHIEKRRAASGLTLFDRSTGFNGPTEHIRAGGGVGILFDQHAGDRGVWCPFFGRLASTTNLPALLSLRTGAPVISIGLFRNGPGKWKIVYQPPHFPPEKVGGRDARQAAINELTANLNGELESFVRSDPAEWFWVHDRWKTPLEKILLAPYRRGVFIPNKGAVPQKIKPFRILLRSPNPLGDACMAIPAIRAIKRGRIDAHLTILCRENLEPLWKRLPEVDAVIPVSKSCSKRKIGQLVRDTADFDAAILLPNSLSSAFEAKYAGIRHITGFEGHSRKRLLDHVVRPRKPGPPDHHVNHYLHLAEQIGADVEDRTRLMQFGGGKTKATPGEIRIGICPGAEYGNAKRYPLDRYSEALDAVRKKIPSDIQVRFLIFGSPNEREIGEELAAMLGDANFNRAGKTTIDGLIEELLTCDVLVSNDTGTMHLAAVMGIPTVAIFGSTEPQLTAPLGANHEVLRHHVECSPCFLRDCAFDYRCMLRLDPHLVEEAVLRVLPPLHRG